MRKLGDERHARVMQWFFKTGKGGYGEGDRFLGIRIPRLRACVRECGEVELPALLELLRSPVHEERMFALLGMVRHWRGHPREQGALYRSYLAHTRHIDNWDLVDASAPAIVGGWLLERSRAPLCRLALERFLARNAPHMPRTMLRYAIEHLPKARRGRYLRMKAS